MLWDGFVAICLFSAWGILYAISKKVDALQHDIDNFSAFVRIMRYNESKKKEK